MWEELVYIFRHFDSKYNSKLFEPHICEEIKIDNDIIYKIITELNGDEAGLVKYDFSAIPVDILGNIYEQYLGHILKKSQKSTKIIEKHAHRKEQGIYYTPTYIVDYIVKNTIVKYIKDKSLDEILDIKILDPACGSGSFLIKTYSKLLELVEKRLKRKEISKNWHSFKNYSGKLNLPQKITILTQCIYGVDLDKKAVEITQLNLLLKLLEGETNETISNLNEIKKLLPMLNNNIKCGNSLIDDEKIAGDKAFQWEKEFKEAIQNGGFDVVVGNPPYGAELTDSQKKYLDTKFNYKSSTKNSAIYFIYLANSLVKNLGMNSFIVPKSLCYSLGWSNCSKLIASDLEKLIDTGKAFEDVLLEQVIFIRTKNVHKNSYINGLCEGNNIREFCKVNKSIFEVFGVMICGLTSNEVKVIENIINRFNKKWGDFVSIERGLNWQNLSKKYPGKTKIYRGAQLYPYFISEAKDNIDLKNFNKNVYEYQLKPKIMNQLAIAHVKNPYPHFFLQAALDSDGQKLVFETISCTFDKSNKTAMKFLLAVNNSKLFAWMLYKFIYSNAIRSTRYDEQYVSRIPCPDFTKIDQKPFIEIIDKILLITKDIDYEKNSIKQKK